ncbi:MAG: FkbM family methyltransferase [Ruminiclostridium sp.]|nr:FkbM family methyltransferase [Ruminiclostridium sp.]
MEEINSVPESRNPAVDVWTALSETKKPIIMYGMGDGAEKILNIMDRYGIKPADFMASDEFVRGHSFRGFRVKKLSEIEELYGDFIVVICFGSALPEVLDRIDMIRRKYETYAPDVPVVGDGLFDSDYISDHEFELMQLKSLLADDPSRNCLDLIMKYRITGDIGILRSCETSKQEAFELLNIGTDETYVDLGAYNGDTVEEFLKYTGKKFKKIYALEPDRRSFSKLRRRLYYISAALLTAKNAAAWNTDTTLTFYNKAGRSSSLSAGNSGQTRGRGIETEAITVDTLLDGKPATLIKYDVEGSEREALLGSEQTIRKYKPRLIVSLYHRTGDLVELPLLINEINPEYRFYLRHHPYVPAWDTNLYCI